MEFVYKAEMSQTPFKHHATTYRKDALENMLSSGARPLKNVVNPKKRSELSGGIEQYVKSAKRVQKTSVKAVVFFKLVTFMLLVTTRLPFQLVMHPIFKALMWFSSLPAPTSWTTFYMGW